MADAGHKTSKSIFKPPLVEVNNFEEADRHVKRIWEVLDELNRRIHREITEIQEVDLANEDNWDDAYTVTSALELLNGLLKCDGAGTFSAITDSSTNWDTAYSHSQIAGGNSVHVSTTENTNWDTAYTHSQIAGGDSVHVSVAENSSWDGAAAHKTTEDAINGIVKCDGAGNYSAVTDNSTAWDGAVTDLTALNAINGLVKCDGAGNFSAVTDSSSNWNAAYVHKTTLDALNGIVECDGVGNYTAITTSAALATVITDETGSGVLVFATSPTLVTPTIGAALATSIQIGANVLDTNEWAFLDGQNQGVRTTDSPTFTNLTVGTAAGHYATFVGGSTEGTIQTRLMRFHLNHNMYVDNGGTWHSLDTTYYGGRITLYNDATESKIRFVAGSKADPPVQSFPIDFNLLTGDVIAGSFTIAGFSLTGAEFLYLDGQDQAVATTSSPTFVTPTVTSLIVGSDIGVVADTDLLQLSSALLTLNGDLYVGANGVADRMIRVHSDAANQYLQLKSFGAYSEIKGAAAALSIRSDNSYVALEAAAGQPMYFDAGGTFYWRDEDSSNATRMTLDSATGALQVNGTTSATGIISATGGSIYAGVNTSVRGLYRAFGQGASTTLGGQYAVYPCADYDTTIDYWAFRANQDWLEIGPDTNFDLLKLTPDLFTIDTLAYASGGIRTKFSTANVSDPPTDAELDSAFGTPAALGAGFVGVLDDAGADIDVWLCYTSDANWYYLQGTKAV